MELTTEQIRQVNDQLRTTLCQSTSRGVEGRVFLTSGVAAFPPDAVQHLLKTIASLGADDFTEDNDPHKEHDMAAIHLFGEKFFFKFDYYDSKREFFGHDIHNMVVMLAEEY
jgi:hypothetical protein